MFSVHSVENPSFESELALLRNFGPNLPDKTLRSIVRAFAQLRSMADQGQLSYPYSTREVINVVKHLEVFLKLFDIFKYQLTIVFNLIAISKRRCCSNRFQCLRFRCVQVH